MNKEMPIIIAHYTIHTGYEEEVQNLLRSLVTFELEYEVKAIGSLGSWRANSNYSIWLIEEMFKKYPGRSLLKVDADAVIKQYPDLFIQPDFDADFAARWQDFRYQKNELLGGTLFFSGSEISQELVRRWKIRCEEKPKEKNPVLLHALVDEMKAQEELKVVNLPAQYCKIYDTMRHYKNPVIEHYQASRRFRKIIDKKGRR